MFNRSPISWIGFILAARAISISLAMLFPRHVLFPGKSRALSLPHARREGGATDVLNATY
jgi:hypothetical protein